MLHATLPQVAGHAGRMEIVIPTFRREEVLVQTLAAVRDELASMSSHTTERRPHREPIDSAGAVSIIDQSPEHAEATNAFLTSAVSEGWLRWVRLTTPSIPRAMNVGLQAARSEVVLFLDDDILPAPGLIEAHLAAHAEFPEACAVVGQVLQPGEVAGPRRQWKSTAGFRADLDFPFWSDERAWVSNVMAGNLSVKREQALAIGGFDENFEGGAYRFETEFARRLIRAGGRILFEPAASLRHLRAERGGTRSEGSHLTSASPRHGMGDYYFAMRSGWSRETIAYMLRRPIREVSTRFHLRRPWWIPVKLVGEVKAFLAAGRLARLAQKLVDRQSCLDS